ncbi:hypothetical protein [Providencia hangzhouensis]
MESVRQILGVVVGVYGSQKSVDEQLVELDKTIADAQEKAR